MKIIEALKKIKDLKRKADDLKDKAKQYCADLDVNTPMYPDQKRQVAEWIQGYSDVVKEIGHLKTSIQRTNLKTMVEIELGGKYVSKCISEWIDRRRELAKMDEDIWRVLTDKGLKDSNYQLTPQSPLMTSKKILYFDPVERDKKVELYRSEPGKIDSTLEITNAITDLIEN